MDTYKLKIIGKNRTIINNLYKLDKSRIVMKKEGVNSVSFLGLAVLFTTTHCKKLGQPLYKQWRTS